MFRVDWIYIPFVIKESNYEKNTYKSIIQHHDQLEKKLTSGELNRQEDKKAADTLRDVNHLYLIGVPFV